MNRLSTTQDLLTHSGILKFISFFTVFLLYVNNTLSCDICGCFMGITPYDNQSTFGIFYRYRSFNGYADQKHNLFPSKSNFFNYNTKPVSVIDEITNQELATSKHSHNKNPNDYEIYRVAELRAKYFIHKRIEINAIMPFVMNSVRYNDVTTHIQGQGDLNLFTGIHVLRKIEVEKLQQRLVVGGGIKLRTGEFYLKDKSGKRIHYLIQPGTGTNDYFAYMNYFASLNKLGFSNNAMIKLSGTNIYKESVAPGFTNYANVFYKLILNEKFSVIPALAFFYEFSQGEIYDNILIGSHGMNNAMLGPSIDIFYKNLSLNILFQKSLFDLETGHPESAGRLVFGVTYNFNQSNYLTDKLFKKSID